MIAAAIDRLPARRTLAALIGAGIAADLAWEIWARAITPAVLGGPLQPAALILSLFRLPPDYYGHAEALHLVTGAVFYPLLFWAIRTHLVRGSRMFDGIVIGLVTWVLALGVFAPLAGLPFMLNFIPLAWMSGVGHVAYGLALSFVYRALDRTA